MNDHLPADHDEYFQSLFERLKRLNPNIDHAEYLYRLIETIQYLHQVQKTDCREWRICQGWLISKVQKLPGLWRSTHHSYEDVLFKTLNEMLERINEFELPTVAEASLTPGRLTGWINKRLGLRYKVIKLYQPNSKEPEPDSLDRPIGSSEDSKPTLLGDLFADSRPSTLWEKLDEIEKDWYQQAEWFIGRKAINYFKQDPDEILRTFCIRKYPQINVQELIRRYYLTFPPQKDSIIVQDLNIDRQRPEHVIRELKGRLAKQYGLPFPPEKKSKTYPISYVVIEFYCGLAALELAKTVVEIINLIVHLPTRIQQLPFRLIDQISIELEH